MSVRIVRLGTKRQPGEGPRIGTVRRPPRGVPKSEFARQDWYDVWYPLLSPSPATLKLGLQADTDAKWAAFARKFRAEMSARHCARTTSGGAIAPCESRWLRCGDSRCHRSRQRTCSAAPALKLALSALARNALLKSAIVLFPRELRGRPCSAASCRAEPGSVAGYRNISYLTRPPSARPRTPASPVDPLVVRRVLDEQLRLDFSGILGSAARRRRHARQEIG
jgi:uncharacterized protein YeaO (DUF488 family)